MKLVRFQVGSGTHAGIVVQDGVIDVAARASRFEGLASLLSAGARAEAAALIRGAAADYPLDEVKLLAPFEGNARVFCIGVNYRSHAAETGRDLPPRPSSFIRTHESIVAPGTPIVRPAVSTHFDYEGELAAVIGTRAHRVSEQDALAYVAGYTCFNDGSVRDYQKFSVTSGKNFDRSGSCGPWIVTADEIPDPTALTLVTRLNGVEVQRSGTDMLIYSIPLIVSFLSEITVLMPGDVIATGTPAGVGSRRVPPLWMKAGDRIEVEISGIGVLANTVKDEEN
ncbi:MAG: putative bifunctional enzyme with isomerase/decarboxylase [Noviherbaspirillum sp.]|nr:putative bifunctional enzyme with isomerase/decarboxylase [Noviherbaspirillum sp.]MDB5794729.1 putative bifunctional enzyme with isomerase/decarboxylase [Noviherbaspirillum sp.]